MKKIDPFSLLNKVQKSLLIDLHDHVYGINPTILGMLEVPEEGIYFKNSIQPLMVESQVYFKASKFGRYSDRIIDFKEVFNLNEDVLDKDGNTVISKKELRARRRYLTMEPELPITAVHLAVNMVNEYLSILAPYAKCGRIKRQEWFVKEEYHYVIEEDLFESVFERLMSEVYTFVGDDTWHIYFTRMINATLVIEKVVDYRIFRYHELETKGVL